MITQQTRDQLHALREEIELDQDPIKRANIDGERMFREVADGKASRKCKAEKLEEIRMACWADHVDHPQDRYFDTLYAVFEDLAASWFRKQKIPRLDLVRTGRISGEQLRQAGVSPRIYRSLIGKLNEELHRKIS